MNDRRNDEDLVVPQQRADDVEENDAQLTAREHDDARTGETWQDEGPPAEPFTQDEFGAPTTDITAEDSKGGDVLASAPAVAVPHEVGPLLEQDPVLTQERWRDLQAAFVDEPRDAVERADQLVDEVVTTLTGTLTTRTAELRDRWKNTDQNDTEQLRLALRDYRDVLERLLTLSGQGTR